MNRSDSEEMAGRLLAAGCAEAPASRRPTSSSSTPARSARRAEQKVIGRQGQLGRLKAANPALRVVLTGCSVREPDRAGLRRRYPAVDLFLRPDEEPELVDRLGLASAQAPIGAAATAARHDDASGGPVVGVADHLAGTRAAAVAEGTVAPRLGDRTPGCRSSTAATRPAPTASSRSAAARSAAGRSTTSSTRPARLAAAGYREVTLLGQNVNSYGHDLAPEARFAHVDAERWAGRRLDLRGPAGPRRAAPGDRRAPDRRRPAGDPAPALRHLAPVGPLGPADRGDGRLRRRSASTSTCRSSRATTRCSAGWAASTRSSTTSSASARIREAVPGIALSTDVIVGFCGETEAQFEATLRAARDGPLRPGLRGRLLAAARDAGDAASPTTSRPPSSGAGSTSCSRSRRRSASSATRRGSAATVEVLVDTVVAAAQPRPRARRGRRRRRGADGGTSRLTGRTPRQQARPPRRATGRSSGALVTVRIDHAGPYALRGSARLSAARDGPAPAAHRHRRRDGDRQDRRWRSRSRRRCRARGDPGRDHLGRLAPGLPRPRHRHGQGDAGGAGAGPAPRPRPRRPRRAVHASPTSRRHARAVARRRSAARGGVAILAGGTGLYLRAVAAGPRHGRAPAATPAVRARLEAELAARRPRAARRAPRGDRPAPRGARSTCATRGASSVPSRSPSSAATRPLPAPAATRRRSLWLGLAVDAGRASRGGSPTVPAPSSTPASSRRRARCASASIPRCRPSPRSAIARRGRSSTASCTLDEAIAADARRNVQFAKRQATWFRREPSLAVVDFDGRSAP